MVSADMSSAASLLIALRHSGGASCCPHPPTSHHAGCGQCSNLYVVESHGCFHFHLADDIWWRTSSHVLTCQLYPLYIFNSKPLKLQWVVRERVGGTEEEEEGGLIQADHLLTNCLLAFVVRAAVHFMHIAVASRVYRRRGGWCVRRACYVLTLR